MTLGDYVNVDPGHSWWPTTDPRYQQARNTEHNVHTCYVQALDFLIVHVFTFGLDTDGYFAEKVHHAVKNRSGRLIIRKKTLRDRTSMRSALISSPWVSCKSYGCKEGHLPLILFICIVDYGTPSGGSDRISQTRKCSPSRSAGRWVYRGE